MGRLGIMPLVADHERAIQFEPPFETRLENQAGLGFATGAVVAFVVRTDEHIIQRQLALQKIVHTIQRLAGLITARQPGLVRGGDDDETRRLQPAQGLRRRLVHMKILHAQGADLMLAIHARSC